MAGCHLVIDVKKQSRQRTYSTHYAQELYKGRSHSPAI